MDVHSWFLLTHVYMYTHIIREMKIHTTNSRLYTITNNRKVEPIYI